MQKTACSLGRPAASAGAGAGARRRGGRHWRRQRRRQTPLGCPLRGLLQDGVDQLVVGGQQRRSVGRAHLRPIRLYLGMRCQERRLPEQPDRQEVGQRAVIAPVELRLPEPPARELCPAAEGGQERVEIGRQRRFAEPEPSDGAPDRLAGIIGRLGDPLREPGKSQDLRRQVVHRRRAPGGPGAAPLRRRPEGLPLIEPVGRPGAEPLVDDAGPGDARCLRRQIGDRRQRARRLRRRPRGGPQLGDRGRPRIGGGGQRGGEIGLGDLARVDLRGVPAARHRHGAARDPGQPRRRHRQAFAGLPEIGVDGDRGGEGPHRRHGAAGGIDGGRQVARGDLGLWLLQHGILRARSGRAKRAGLRGQG